MNNSPQKNQAIVYITMYSGLKLPKWYIGSSTTNRIDNGYNGSVTSVKYSKIWKSERKHNPQLFSTKIISYHITTQEALDEELRLQKLHQVVRNPKYINMSYCQRNGFHGGDTSKFIDYTNPKRLKKISESVSGKKNGNYGKQMTAEDKLKNPKFFENHKRGKDNPNHGSKASEETKLKQSIASKGKNNSNYGNCWCVLETAENKSKRKLHPKDDIPQGWISCAQFDDNKKDKSKHHYGKSWYNDGTKNYLKFAEDATNLLKGRIGRTN